MANKMVANIKSLSDGVTGLTKHVNELYAALAKVNIVASKSLKEAKGAVNTVGGTANLTKGDNRPGTGADGATFPTATSNRGGNLIYNGMAKFSSFAQTPTGSTAVLGAQVGLSIAAGAFAAVPDTSLTLQRSVGYYQAGLRSPGINRNQLERATFGAMKGGLSSTGSDAIVAATLAGRGYTPGSTNYLQAVSQVGGAYKYLGMENAAATQAIAGFQTGAMGANLFQYGISTTGAGGKEKTTGQIAKELMTYMTGGAKVSTEQVRSSYQKGALGANLSTMGFDAAQQEILYQAMIDISSGRNPDLAKAKPMAGNENTALTSAGRMASSQTALMTKAEDSMIKGFEHAADTVEAFNRVLSNVVQPLGELKAYLSGVGGSNAGSAAATTGGGVMASIGSFAFKYGKKALGAGAIATAGLEELFSGGAVTPLAVAQAALGVKLLKGGSTSGYGSSFGVGNRDRRGGASPVTGALVSAGYGATDNTGIWSGTNNTHTGTDYQTPIGTPVLDAYADGVVSQVDINADYGKSVMVDHADGVQTVYAHLSERTVNVGDQVKLGQRIGKSGESGNANGPHLHFELRNGKNNPVDPSKYMSGGGKSGSTNDLLSMGYSSILPLTTDVLGSSKSSTSASTNASSTNNGTVAMGSKEQQSWATDFLTKTGKPVTESNLKALTTWMRAEGKGWSTSLNRATYNPLNSTLEMSGSVGYNGPGVQAYVSPEQGMEATISTLTGKSADIRGYTAIMNALAAGTNAQDVLKAIDNSAWRSGKVGKGGYNFPTKGGASTGYGAAIVQHKEDKVSHKMDPVTNPLSKKMDYALIQLPKKTDPSVAHLPKKMDPVTNSLSNNLTEIAPAPSAQGNKTINITLKIEKASTQEAERFAKLVKTYLENDKDIAKMGSS